MSLDAGLPPDGGSARALPARRRRRRRGGFIALMVVTVLLVGLVIAADFVARAYARQLIGDELRTAFALEESEPLDVEVGGFSMLLQLARGELDRVDVASESVTFGELTGSVDVTGLAVPLDQSQPVEELSVDFAISGDQLENLSANLSGLPITAVELAGENIRVTTGFEVFGASIPIELAVTPGAEGGQLTFTPASISLNEATVTADELRRLFGTAADPVLRTQPFCIAQYLPGSFALDAAGIRGDEIVLEFTADGAVLGEVALAQKGTCPAE